MRQLAELLAASPLPNPSGGKDEKGTILVIGGPPKCPGAALLAGTAALRTGSGRVQLCVDPTVAPHVAVTLPEAAVLGWDLRLDVPQDVADSLGHADVVIIGVGHSHVRTDAVRAVADATDAPIVLDAGALHAATGIVHRHAVVVAPNGREASELLGGDEPSEEHLAAALCERLGQPVAVRGTVAVVADEGNVWCFDQLPPGLGTPGSGDVFVGALASLLGNGCKPQAALGWAIALHAGAARLLAADTPVGYLASDIAHQLPRALTGARQ